MWETPGYLTSSFSLYQKFKDTKIRVAMSLLAASNLSPLSFVLCLYPLCEKTRNWKYFPRERNASSNEMAVQINLQAFHSDGKTLITRTNKHETAAFWLCYPKKPGQHRLLIVSRGLFNGLCGVIQISSMQSTEYIQKLWFSFSRSDGSVVCSYVQRGKKRALAIAPVHVIPHITYQGVKCPWITWVLITRMAAY